MDKLNVEIMWYPTLIVHCIIQLPVHIIAQEEHVLIQLVDVVQHSVQIKQIKLIVHLFIQEIYRILSYVNGMKTHVQMLQEYQS